MSVDGWMGKEDVKGVCVCVCVCVCVMEYYSVIKKNEIMPLAATWIDLEIIILSEVSQTEKDKWYHLYVDSTKMIQMNLSTKQK